MSSSSNPATDSNLGQVSAVPVSIPCLQGYPFRHLCRRPPELLGRPDRWPCRLSTRRRTVLFNPSINRLGNSSSLTGGRRLVGPPAKPRIFSVNTSNPPLFHHPKVLFILSHMLQWTLYCLTLGRCERNFATWLSSSHTTCGATDC